MQCSISVTARGQPRGLRQEFATIHPQPATVNNLSCLDATLLDRLFPAVDATPFFCDTAWENMVFYLTVARGQSYDLQFFPQYSG